MEQINHLASYLKNMLEGNTDIRFKRWFNQNIDYLRLILTDPEFSRLKFKPIEFAEKYLNANNITYVKNVTAINREIFLMQFSPDFLNEVGDLKEEKLLEVYDGIVRKYLTDDQTVVISSINKILKKSNGTKSVLTEETLDFLYFSEILAYKNKQMSIFFTQTISLYFANKGLFFSEINNTLERIKS